MISLCKDNKQQKMLELLIFMCITRFIESLSTHIFTLLSFFQISHFYSPLFCDRSVSVQPSGVGVSIAFEKIVSAMLEQEDVSIFDEMETSSRGLFVQFDAFSFLFFFC